MIDWGAVVLTPVMGVFGEPAMYTPSPRSPVFAGAAFQINVVFDNAYVEIGEVSGPGAMSRRPVFGVRLAEFPAGFDPEEAQGDMITMPGTGRVYVVKSGRPDSHGGARLDCNLQFAG